MLFMALIAEMKDLKVSVLVSDFCDLFFYFCLCISVFVCVSASHVCLSVQCGLHSLRVGTEFTSPGRRASILNP